MSDQEEQSTGGLRRQLEEVLAENEELKRERFAREAERFAREAVDVLDEFGMNPEAGSGRLVMNTYEGTDVGELREWLIENEFEPLDEDEAPASPSTFEQRAAAFAAQQRQGR